MVIDTSIHMKDNLHRVGKRLSFSFSSKKRLFFRIEQRQSIQKYSYQCFLCHSTDIDKVTADPFRPPNAQTYDNLFLFMPNTKVVFLFLCRNPWGLCSQCPIFDFTPWRLNTRFTQ